jgi:hypothetical protein
MEGQEDTFVLMVRSLLEKGVENVDSSHLTDGLRKEFDVVGDKFLIIGSYAEAAGTYYLSGNILKLKQVGLTALRAFKFEAAAAAFRYAKDTKGLIDVGNAFLGEGRLKDAYSCFKLSGNEEMIKFFEENFAEGVAEYI